MKQREIKRGMVLAAGLGTRLLPITEKLPKPLVPVLNVPNILYSLALLERAGIHEVILNLHHLPEKLERYLGDGREWGLKLAYSKEQLLLGTGGGLKRAESFFKGEPLVLANCDFITDFDLRPAIRSHIERDALCTMVLWENPEKQLFYSKVGVDEGNHLCSLPRHSIKEPTRTGIFTGIHILENAAFPYLKEVPSGINEVLYPALMKEAPQRIFGTFMERSTYWYDTGELKYFWSTSMHLLESLFRGDEFLKDFLTRFGKYEEKAPGIWAPKETKLPTGVTLVGPVILGKNCHFGSNVTVGPYSVLGDGVEVGDEAQFTKVVILGPTKIPDGRACANALQFEQLVLPMDQTH